MLSRDTNTQNKQNDLVKRARNCVDCDEYSEYRRTYVPIVELASGECCSAAQRMSK